MQIKVLAIGDVVGKGGMEMLRGHLAKLQKEKDISFTVINGENASGLGISPKLAEEILDLGADCITLGNHSWARKEIIPYLSDSYNVIRPINFAPKVPGWGYGVFDRPFGRIIVINAIGRCGMDFGFENPFLLVNQLLEKEQADIVLLDFHAEATSEKLAMAHYLDGRVSAVWGTHTHVQTSDAMVFPKGTGYITDLGMTGPAHSVLGVLPEQSVSMFLGNPRNRFEEAPGACKLEGAVITINTLTKRCEHVEALRIYD